MVLGVRIQKRKNRSRAFRASRSPCETFDDLSRRHSQLLRAELPHETRRGSWNLFCCLVPSDSQGTVSSFLHGILRIQPLENAFKGECDGAHRVRPMVERRWRSEFGGTGREPL